MTRPLVQGAGWPRPPALAEDLAAELADRQRREDQQRFQFSLDCVLDGIAARLAPPPGPEPGHQIQ
jgi:hypothetical protein